MRNYEMMVCFRPDLDEEATGAIGARLQGLVGNRGGTVTKDQSMGRRRLAYPIRRYHEGLYQVVTFTLPPQNLAELDQQIRLDEDILRHLVIKEGE